MGAQLPELLRAGPGPVDLAAVNTRATPGVPASEGKAWAREQMMAIGEELARQQEMLFAAAQVAPAGTLPARRRVLLVLQGMDCAGKGGTVRHVAGAMNPIGLKVVAFGPPTAQERARHFLWRVTQALPLAGQVGVFDRSHYEDVLIARVRSLVPERTWQRRYEEINQWEAELAAGGTTVVKVMLHLSFKEQARRLLSRLDNPHKHWKFHPSDVDEREFWDDYQAAYTDALTRCDTEAAPWFVVPADRKWYRNWAVASLLLAKFRELRLAYPPAQCDLAQQRRRLQAVVGFDEPKWEDRLAE